MQTLARTTLVPVVSLAMAIGVSPSLAGPDTAAVTPRADNTVHLTGKSRNESSFIDARLTQGDDAAVREEIARLKQLADAVFERYDYVY